MYYLTNFRTALQWVGERYADLLDPPERDFLRDFDLLPAPSQALLVRLIMRKGDLFRESKVVYPEIGDVGAASIPLINRGWLDPRPALQIGELFKLLKRAELARMFAALKPGVLKSDALALLSPDLPDARPLDAWLATDERVLRVTVAALCARFRILFFGNFRQQWSEFVLADLGVFHYEKVEFSRDSRAFQTRQEIEDLYVLYECRECFHADMPPRDVLAKLPRRPLGNEWLEARRAKLLYQIAQAHERAGEPALAIPLYAESAHPGARLRHARLMELTGRRAEAHELVNRALESPGGDAERQKLLRMQRRLERQPGSARVPSPPRTQPQRLDFTLAPPAVDESVEYAVVSHLSAPGAPVFFVENTLLNSLFGLLFWDAIFAAVRGAFFHPFQSAPADLYSAEFHARRRADFDRGFALLRRGEHRTLIRRQFLSKQGIQSPFVFWGALPEALLELALDCIPEGHLERCFERLLENLDENCSGLPDLIQFWPHRREYRMIEVKGPGDRLQDNQIRWMDFCMQNGIPICVCHVRWAESISIQ